MAKSEEEKAADKAAKEAAKAQAAAEKEAAAKAKAEADAADKAAKEAAANASSNEQPQRADSGRKARWAAFLEACRAQREADGTLSVFEAQEANGEFDKIPDSFV